LRRDSGLARKRSDRDEGVCLYEGIGATCAVRIPTGIWRRTFKKVGRGRRPTFETVGRS
jgi:hypothetical protein